MYGLLEKFLIKNSIKKYSKWTLRKILNQKLYKKISQTNS